MLLADRGWIIRFGFGDNWMFLCYWQGFADIVKNCSVVINKKGVKGMICVKKIKKSLLTIIIADLNC